MASIIDEEMGLNKDQFTVIGVDRVGYGFSRPPERVFSLNAFAEDANIVSKLMEKLGFKHYSVLGQCEGAKAAILLTLNHPERVKKLLLVAASANLTHYDISALKKYRDIQTFNEDYRLKYKKVYSDDEIQRIWQDSVDFTCSFENNPSEYWDVRKLLPKISCQTLVMHGLDDSLMSRKHPDTLEKCIPYCRVIKVEGGGHDFHQEFVEQFNKSVEEFLNE